MLLGSITTQKKEPQQSIEITGVFYQLGCGDQRWHRICGDRGSFSYEPLDDFLWSFDPESYLESTFAALNVGTEMIDGLRALAAKHELIGDVRGSGLFIGVEMGARPRLQDAGLGGNRSRGQRHAPAPGANQRDVA